MAAAVVLGRGSSEGDIIIPGEPSPRHTTWHVLDLQQTRTSDPFPLQLVRGCSHGQVTTNIIGVTSDKVDIDP